MKVSRGQDRQGGETVEITFRSWRISVEYTPRTDAELAAMYDEAAERWHERVQLLGYTRAYGGLFARLEGEGLLDPLRGGGRVLDCGIGTGTFVLALIRRVAAPVRIDGVDVSPTMLDQADLNLERAGAEYYLHRCDIRKMPFGDGTIDAVLGAHVLEHLPDPLAGLSEMARVLKPGGPLVVITTRRGVLSALVRLRCRYSLTREEQLVRWMEEVGLRDVGAYPLTAGGPLPRRVSVARVGFKKGALR